MTPAKTTTSVLAIKTAVTLGSVADTAALFSAGTAAAAIDGGAGSLQVHALTASAKAGGIDLSGTNQLQQLGIETAIAGFSVAASTAIPGVVANNDITVKNLQSLTVVQQGADIANAGSVISNLGSVSISVTSGDLTNNATIQGQTNVLLTAERDINNNNLVTRGQQRRVAERGP